MIRESGGAVAIDLLVQPRSSRPRIGPVHDQRIKVAVAAPPVDGAANKAVIDLFARRLGVPRSAIAITAGSSSRRKTLTVRGVSGDAVRELLR